MKKIKTDKNTQSICNTLAYQDLDLLEKNAAVARKPVEKKGEKILFRFDDLNMTVSVPYMYVPKRNNPLGKVFAYVLSEIPFDANGKPKESEVVIPLKQFAKDGLYTKKTNALRGLITAGKVLRHIDVEITKRNPLNKTEMEHCSYRCDSLFNGFSISDDKSSLIIVINEKAPWRLFKNQYIDVPDDWFLLPSRSFDLAQNIAIVARRSATTIAKQGYIDIDLREVAFWISLPDDSDSRNSGKLIKHPIINAISDINSIRSDFTIESHFDTNRPASDFLDRGFIRIYVEGKTKADISIIARKRSISRPK